jgi:hypothetical protein
MHDPLDATAAAPEFHRVLLENETVRVLETRIEPGQIVPLHTHRWPAVYYSLSRGEIVRRDQTGRVEFDSRLMPLSPAPVTWAPPLGPHTLENVGKTVVHGVSVDGKGGDNGSELQRDLRWAPAIGARRALLARASGGTADPWHGTENTCQVPPAGGNPFRNTYSDGKGFVWAEANCRITIIDCGPSKNGACGKVKVKVRCNSSMWADDKFEEPLGIPRSLGGDVFGDPYWFTTRWEESFEGTTSIDAPCKK